MRGPAREMSSVRTLAAKNKNLGRMRRHMLEQSKNNRRSLDSSPAVADDSLGMTEQW
jgi:hypothetical protein